MRPLSYFALTLIICLGLGFTYMMSCNTATTPESILTAPAVHQQAYLSVYNELVHNAANSSVTSLRLAQNKKSYFHIIPEAYATEPCGSDSIACSAGGCYVPSAGVPPGSITIVNRNTGDTYRDPFTEGLLTASAPLSLTTLDSVLTNFNDIQCAKAATDCSLTYALTGVISTTQFGSLAIFEDDPATPENEATTNRDLNNVRLSVSYGTVGECTGLVFTTSASDSTMLNMGLRITAATAGLVSNLTTVLSGTVCIEGHTYNISGANEYTQLLSTSACTGVGGSSGSSGSAGTGTGGSSGSSGSGGDSGTGGSSEISFGSCTTICRTALQTNLPDSALTASMVSNTLCQSATLDGSHNITCRLDCASVTSGGSGGSSGSSDCETSITGAITSVSGASCNVSHLCTYNTSGL